MIEKTIYIADDNSRFENENDVWLAIPGFPKYKINRNTGTVISTCRGKERCISIKYNTVNMSTETGMRTGTTLPRVLYSAIHRIDIRDIPKKAVIRMNKDGEPYLISRETINREIAYNLRRSTLRVDVLQEYRKSIEFIELVLSCYESGDFAPIYVKIQNMKGLIINYIKKRFLISDEYSLDMTWYAVSELALDDIVNKKRMIPMLEYYLKSISRSYVAKNRLCMYGKNSIDDPNNYLLNVYR
jgi:hypothetical protein